MAKSCPSMCLMWTSASLSIVATLGTWTTKMLQVFQWYKFQPFVYIMGKNLENIWHLCVIRPQTINNNQNKAFWRLAIYPSYHMLNCSKFLQVFSLDETMNGMSNNKMKIKWKWINLFNYCGGSNPKNKWTITFFKFVPKCHPKVINFNEKTNIKMRWKCRHKGNPYGKWQSWIQLDE